MFFVQTAKNQLIVFKFFEKYAKIIQFLKKSLQIFENSPASAGGSAPDPLQGRLSKVAPETKSCRRPYIRKAAI